MLSKTEEGEGNTEEEKEQRVLLHDEVACSDYGKDGVSRVEGEQRRTTRRVQG